MQMLTVDANGYELNFSQCDCCEWFVDSEEMSHGYAYGLETTACRRCGSGDVYTECLLRGRPFPSTAEAARW